MFTDKIDIEVKAGNGGDGKLSFRHEKYVAKGGPDGGDGGRGGDIIFEVDHNLNTLSYFRSHRKIEAENGKHGENAKKAGHRGESITVKVPPGTVVVEGDKIIADLTTESQRVVIAEGGRGGFGNSHFTSSTRQTPRLAERGEPGERKSLTLELKLVADVGLVGLPNAGKSTLLSVISNAKPEIADYPFTTLVPNLGVVDANDFSFVAADIPGLIEGASHGKGLGDEFLRHVERTAVIWHLIDANSTDPVKDWQTVMTELKTHSKDLAKKDQIVVLTKIDSVPEEELAQKLKSLKAKKLIVVSISAVAHKGLAELLRAARKPIEAARAKAIAVDAEAIPVIDESTIEDGWEVKKTKTGFEISGKQIEKFAARTNFAQPDAVARLRHILARQGVAKELQKRRIKTGDIVRIGPHELEWL